MQITIYGFVYFCGREVRRGKLHIKLRYFKRAKRKEGRRIGDFNGLK